ncbi:MAG: type II secretion system protein, partial [Synergistaceae bacterium]|nr:type II secretion system protein [Synergistaceae bacterium]
MGAVTSLCKVAAREKTLRRHIIMKKFRKGFTLVELLIVLAVLGSLSAMMTGASSDAIDTSTASAILGNLRTLKAAAFEM